MSLKSKFSSELYRARKNHKYTQRDVASKMEITEQYYQRIESGKCQPSLNLFLALTDFLDIDANQFKKEVRKNEIK